jgi:hypothetical protein
MKLTSCLLPLLHKNSNTIKCVNEKSISQNPALPSGKNEYFGNS